MDILFVVPYVPNLVRTRPYNLIRHLTQRGNRVTVLTLWTNEQERAQLQELRQICHHVQALPMPLWHSLYNTLLALPGRKPLQSVFSWKSKLVSGLNGASANGRSLNGHSKNGRSPYDVIHVEHLRGSRYGLYLKTHTDLPVVWDSVDCISHLFRQAAGQSKNMIGRLRSRLDLGRTERYEGEMLDRFDHVVVTSPLDKRALLKLKPNGTSPAPVSVVGNGVDTEHFTPDDGVPRDPATLVISGKMSYHANISMTLHLVRNIMPHVWAQRPDVKLLIAGKDPSREIQALAENPNVTVTGTVDALPPYLRRATIAVAPITYGAGIQNKVLEAMACATPVITSSQAVSALRTIPGWDVVVADDAPAYAEAIITLLNQPKKQEMLGRNGRVYVEKYHHWPNVAARFEEIYEEAIRTRRSRTGSNN